MGFDSIDNVPSDIDFGSDPRLILCASVDNFLAAGRTSEVASGVSSAMPVNRRSFFFFYQSNEMRKVMLDTYRNGMYMDATYG